MSQGPGIEVLAPVALKRKISGLLAEAASQYSSEFARFELTQKQDEKLKEWLAGVAQRAAKKQDGQILNGDESLATSCNPKLKLPYYGSIGGGISITFTPNGVGLCCRATEAITGESIDLTDYESY